MSVHWTTNSDGAHEISSTAHLLQVMNRGALGVDTGAAPTDYWSVSYVQTRDIDLADVHGSIVPIGDYSTNFTGAYNGGLFHIKNLGYTGSALATGLFGYCEGVTLTQIRLSGAWVTTGGQVAGLLCGHMNGCIVTDIEATFSEGTVINGTSESIIGCLVGHVHGGSFTGLRIDGTLGILGEPEAGGGLIGKAGGGAIITQCENTATFLTTSTAEFNPGGIIGEMYGSTLSACLDGMVGENARYDIAEAGTDAFEVAGDVFQTGDDVSVSLDRKVANTTFVSTGGELSVVGVNNVLLPFDVDNSDAQNVVLKLTDESEVSVSLDQELGGVDVNGEKYAIGDYFVLDNKKVTVVDI